MGAVTLSWASSLLQFVTHRMLVRWPPVTGNCSPARRTISTGSSGDRETERGRRGVVTPSARRCVLSPDAPRCRNYWQRQRETVTLCHEMSLEPFLPSNFTETIGGPPPTSTTGSLIPKDRKPGHAELHQSVLASQHWQLRIIPHSHAKEKPSWLAKI